MNPLEFLVRYELTIYVLTIGSCAFFAGLIFLLLRYAKPLQAKEWVIPFADALVVLSILYVLLLVNSWRRAQLPDDQQLSPWDAINLTTLLFSGVTNYLFLLSAFMFPEPALDRSWIFKNDKLLQGRPYFRARLLWLLCAIALLQVLDGVALIPDAVCSVIALLLMGLALFKNNVRTDPAVAWVALVSAIVYSVVYFLSVPMIAEAVVVPLAAIYWPDVAKVKDDFIRDLGVLVSLISVFLKLGYFLSAYSLMLWISSPLEGIENLLRGVTREQGEFLDTKSLVKSICDQLRVKAVILYIQQPGAPRGQKSEIARFEFTEAERPVTNQPTILKYDESATYHDVIASGKWDRHDNEDSFFWLFPKAAEIGVPLFFHNSVIACLTAVVEHGQTFPEGDRINLQRFADLISPAVQTYREMSALNKLNQELGKLQIDVRDYELEKNIRQIAEKVDQITSPKLTFIQVDRGFYSYPPVFCGLTLSETTRDEYTNELKRRQGEEDFVSDDGRYRWLTRQLMIPCTVNENNKTSPPVFGHFALGVSNDIESSEQRAHPTIGTDPTCRRAVGDLVSDTLLDFIRGSLNQLNDKLGVRLSEGRTIQDWHKAVEKTAKDAKLIWVVASYSDDDDHVTTHFLGDPRWIETVKELERLAHETEWTKKGSDLWLCPFEKADVMSGQVIRRTLIKSQNELRKTNDEAQVTFWLGVGRKEFGEELDEKSQWGISPWTYFLDHFCDIADAGLLRLLEEQRGVDQSLWMTELLRFAGPNITAAVVAHDIKNLAAQIDGTPEVIERAAHNGDGQALSNAITRLRNVGETCRATLLLFKDALEGNAQQQCSLEDTIKRVSHKIERETNIRISRSENMFSLIDVPYYVAFFALKAVLDNSRAALGTTGEIKIQIDRRAHEIVCRITDNGPGISDEIRKTLLKRPTKGRPDGHGYGLYLSKLMLRAFAGKIILHPPDDSRGTTFSIYFRQSKQQMEPVTEHDVSNYPIQE